MRSRISLIAESAFACVESAARDTEARPKKYGALCLNLPALLQTNGLAQTAAFLQAKSAKQPHARLLLLHLARLVMPGAQGSEDQRIQDFVRHARMSDQLTYRELTRTARTASVWLKRYAEAQLRVEVADEDEDEVKPA